MEANAYQLYMKGITKKFYGVAAVKNVDFIVKRGQIHALMGENGAGKSTLMKVLSGVHMPEEGGEIIWNGQSVRFQGPKDALAAGISMIYQELNPIRDMTIAENIYLGREPMRNKLMVDFKAMNRNAAELLARMGLDINPRTTMSSLSVAKMQVIEIAKAADHGAELFIMDEPTSALAEKEIETLFALIRQLKAGGSSIIYITHKLDEVFEIADEITVMRDGGYIGTYPVKEMNKDRLIKLMVDRELKEMFPTRKEKPASEVRLRVKNLTKKGTFEDISYDAHKGEILGFAGLLGSGRSEAMEGLFGVHKLDRGEVEIEGKSLPIKLPKDAMNAGIGFVTEDRKYTGLVLPMSVRDNLTLPHLPQICHLRTLIRRKKENAAAGTYVKRLRIKVTGLSQLVQNLSGGNQQKVVVGKWLMNEPNILILDEPTRGIDVGAKAEIYQMIAALADEGMTILMVSSEMEEIMGMCDRIIVFHEGRISGEVLREEFSQERLLKLATGS